MGLLLLMVEEGLAGSLVREEHGSPQTAVTVPSGAAFVFTAVF